MLATIRMYHFARTRVDYFLIVLDHSVGIKSATTVMPGYLSPTGFLLLLVDHTSDWFLFSVVS
jgi:hypothetical protein